MVTTELISSEYKDGKRIDTVVHTYTIADDVTRLGQLYYRFGQILYEADSEKEIAALQLMINTQHEIIKGYGELSRVPGDINAASPTTE